MHVDNRLELDTKENEDTPQTKNNSTNKNETKRGISKGIQRTYYVGEGMTNKGQKVNNVSKYITPCKSDKRMYAGKKDPQQKSG